MVCSLCFVCFSCRPLDFVIYRFIGVPLVRHIDHARLQIIIPDVIMYLNSGSMGESEFGMYWLMLWLGMLRLCRGQRPLVIFHGAAPRSPSAASIFE